MRTVLTSTLILLILASGNLPTVGTRFAVEKARMACCQKPAGGTGCENTPMPCCTIRPAHAPLADVPPSSPRAETPAQAYLHLSPQTLIGFQASGSADVHPHGLSARLEPLRLYRLHSTYLI